jgi:hypothetical protein
MLRNKYHKIKLEYIFIVNLFEDINIGIIFSYKHN